MSVHRYASVRDVASAIICSALAVVLLVALLGGRADAPAMGLLLAGLFGAGAAMLWRQWWIDRTLLLSLGENGFSLRRSGQSVTVRWAAIGSIQMVRINGKIRAYLVRPLQGPEIRLRHVLSNFDALGTELLARTGARPAQRM